MNFYEVIGMLAATLTTISFFPQVYKTWKTKSTEGLSLTMYLVFLVGVILWLIYGIHLNSFPMILANIITAILALYLVVMKIKYK